MTTLITRAELARRGSVKPPTVTVLCRKRLKDACVGKKVDVDHPSVIKWLKSRDIKVIEVSDADRHLMEHWKTDRPNGAAELHRIKEMKILEVVRRFGTEDAYNNWLKSLKLIEDLEAAKLKNDKARGSVIDTELVRNHVMSLIDGTYRRFLGDTVKTLARKTMDMTKAGATVEEIEATVRDIVSSQLKSVKEQSRKKLRAIKDA